MQLALTIRLPPGEFYYVIVDEDELIESEIKHENIS
jgi:hypothetical protein